MPSALNLANPVNPAWNAARGMFGALAGGTAGFFLTGWLARQGFYTMLLPGALLGLGCGWLIRWRSIPVAATCGVAAMALGVFTEWSHFPFVKDQSLGFFLRHVIDLPPVRLLMIALGGLGGYWFGLGGAAKAAPPAPVEAGKNSP